MGSSGLISFHLCIFFIFLFFFISLPVSNSSEDGGVCKNVNCGQGKCRPAFLGFDCDCFPGWQKVQIGPLTYPACVIPNCTVDLQCGNRSAAPAPPPPPPPPFFLPPINITSPCLLVWCGDGKCMPKGNGYFCQCNEDSGNLFQSPTLACFKQCYLGGNCNNVTIGSPATPESSTAQEKGWNGVSFWSRILLVSILTLPTITYASWS